MIKLSELNNQDNPDTVIRTLLEKGNPRVVQDGIFDYLLVEKFFPMLGESFKTRHLVTDDEVENFKKSFKYECVGIKEKEKEQLLSKIQKMKSIDRIISTIEKHIPEETKKEIVLNHIKGVWISQNCNGDLKRFISSLNKDYWGLE